MSPLRAFTPMKEWGGLTGTVPRRASGPPKRMHQKAGAVNYQTISPINDFHPGNIVCILDTERKSCQGKVRSGGNHEQSDQAESPRNDAPNRQRAISSGNVAR